MYNSFSWSKPNLNRQTQKHCLIHDNLYVLHSSSYVSCLLFGQNWLCFDFRGFSKSMAIVIFNWNYDDFSLSYHLMTQRCFVVFPSLHLILIFVMELGGYPEVAFMTIKTDSMIGSIDVSLFRWRLILVWGFHVNWNCLCVLIVDWLLTEGWLYFLCYFGFGSSHLDLLYYDSSSKSILIWFPSFHCRCTHSDSNYEILVNRIRSTCPSLLSFLIAGSPSYRFRRLSFPRWKLSLIQNFSIYPWKVRARLNISFEVANDRFWYYARDESVLATWILCLWMIFFFRISVNFCCCWSRVRCLRFGLCFSLHGWWLVILRLIALYRCAPQSRALSPPVWHRAGERAWQALLAAVFSEKLVLTDSVGASSIVYFVGVINSAMEKMCLLCGLIVLSNRACLFLGDVIEFFLRKIGQDSNINIPPGCLRASQGHILWPAPNPFRNRCPKSQFLMNY